MNIFKVALRLISAVSSRLLQQHDAPEMKNTASMMVVHHVDELFGLDSPTASSLNKPPGSSRKIAEVQKRFSR